MTMGYLLIKLIPALGGAFHHPGQTRLTALLFAGKMSVGSIVCSNVVRSLILKLIGTSANILPVSRKTLLELGAILLLKTVL